MTPLQAWSIISGNLSHLYKMPKANSSGSFKGYTDEDLEAEVMCYKALKEMQERQEKKDGSE